MMDIYHEQSKNIWKTWFLMTMFFVVIVFVGFIFSAALQNSTILYVAIFFSIFMNFFSYWFSDKIILSMYRAEAITRESNAQLWNIVENLAITAGLPMPKVYIISDDAPNAFATGRNKDHAAVVVTSGLLRLLNKTELEGVISHELSHIGNRDILISTIVVVLVGFVSILANMFLHSAGSLGFRERDRNGPNILFMILSLFFALLGPVSATLIQLAISRKREYLADASGALLTRYPEGLASALQKISQNARPMMNANKATAHLFIANPFGRMGTRIQGLMATHPPVEERIRILRGMRNDSF